MERVGEAVVDKVKKEAERITSEAEQDAQAERDRAKKQRQARIESEEQRRRTRAQEEAARLEAQGAIKGRQAVAEAKAEVVNELVEQVKNSLPQAKTSQEQLRNLISESIRVLDSNKIRIYVAQRDMSLAQEVVRQDKTLSKRISDVRQTSCTGGVIAEDSEGKLSIDNTYDTRMEMLLPRLMPDISKQLF